MKNPLNLFAFIVPLLHTSTSRRLAFLFPVATDTDAFVLFSSRQRPPLPGASIVMETSCALSSYKVVKRMRKGNLFLSKQESGSESLDDDDEDSVIEASSVDVVLAEEDEEFATEDLDWIPDRIKSQARRLENRIPAAVVEKRMADIDQTSNSKDRPSPYTEEEEEIISSMGGKTRYGGSTSRREIGYLGDSTLREIAMDYSVPVSYLADVLCMWGVLPPIQIDDVPLGDMVTGEQAFALLEAVNSLDVGALNDRYSNTDLRQLCYEYDIDLQEAFSMVMKEGWSLPFGVSTCLRVEQEDELLRVLRHEGSDMTTDALDNADDEDYDYGEVN